MKTRAAFTMIELIFVIVVMGIIGKFGVEFMVEAYKGFINSKINHQLQATSELTVEIIAARLEHRIKDSVIARDPNTNNPIPLGSIDPAVSYKVLEWIGVDDDGFRGSSTTTTNNNIIIPDWSGILDLNNVSANSNVLVSPETNTTKIANLISILSDGSSTISNAALYFVGSNSDATIDYGWAGNTTHMKSQLGAMHPIDKNTTDIKYFSPKEGSFSGVDVYEYYKLAWTAYAIVYETGTNNKGILRLYWNYQPWLGDNLNSVDTKSAILMENVSSFRFMGIGSIMKIQVCTKSDLVEEYSLCKEKTVF